MKTLAVCIILMFTAVFPALAADDVPEGSCTVSLRDKKQPWNAKQDAVSAVLRNDFHYLGLLGWPGTYVPFCNEMYLYSEEICVIEDFTTCIIVHDPEEVKFQKSVEQYANEHNRIVHGLRVKRGMEK